METLFRYGIACALEDDLPAAWPITLRGDMEYIAQTARAIGYQGIELQLRDPQQYDGKRLRAIADEAGLVFTAIATGREQLENGLSLISDDAAVRRAAVDALKAHVDLAAILGCMVIVGTLRASIPDPSRFAHYEGYLVDACNELTAYAAPKGVPLVVENITASLSNYLNTIRQVTDFVLRLDGYVGVHLDTYSMLQEENDIADAVNYSGSRLRYVHYSDSGRFYPGGGNVDFKTFTKALYRADYRGFIVTECRPWPDGYACAKRGYDYITAIDNCARIELLPDMAGR